MLLLSFIFVVFAIIGVQLFAGATHQRCIDGDTNGTAVGAVNSSWVITGAPHSQVAEFMWVEEMCGLSGAYTTNCTSGRPPHEQGDRMAACVRASGGRR